MSTLTFAAHAVLIFHLLATTPVHANNFKDWRQHGALKAPTGRFVRISLTPNIFDACDHADLSDLRLADSKGTEVPHAIIREKEIREEVELAGQVLNLESPTPDSSRITVDFGGSVVKNRISVATAGSNFRRKVRVEGSADQVSWAEVLPEGWLFAVPGGPRFERLDLGPNNHRYLRVTVSRMPEEPRAPGIDSVQCRHVVVRKPAESERGAVLQSYATETTTRQSTAFLDFGLRHLPVARLKITLGSDPQRVFRRECQVFGRNSLEEKIKVRFETKEYGGVREIETPWTRLGSGALFRDATGAESLELSVEAPYRYLKCVIENADSPPLDVSGVTGVLHPVHVIFEPAGQTSFMLHCGNQAAEAPVYEATSTLVALDVRTLPTCEVAALVLDTGARTGEPPAGQTAVWVCLGVVVVATLALLWWTAVSGMKKPVEAGETPGQSAVLE